MNKGLPFILIFTILILLTSCVGKQEAVEVTGGVGDLVVTEDAGSQSFFEIPITVSATKKMRLTNVGKLPLVNLGIGEFRKESEIDFVRGKAPNDPGMCKQGMLLNVGESCSFDIIFEPSISGEWTESLEVKYNDGVENKFKTIDYHATAGDFALLRTDDDFNSDLGVFELSTSISKIIKITNLGGLPAYELNGYFSGTGLFDFVGGQYPGIGGTCGRNLPSNGTCLVAVAFEASILGFHSRDLILDYKNPHSDQSLIIGLGATAAEIKANLSIFKAPLGNLYDFGAVTNGTTASKKISIYNGGYFPATITSMSIGAPFSITNDTCGSTVDIRELCTIDLEFTPMMKTTYSLPLTINYHDGKTSNVILATAVGEGLLPGSVDVLSGPTLINSYMFPPTGVHGKTSKVFTLKNQGDGVVSNLALSLSSTEFSYSTTCSSDLGPGSLCYLTVNYAPTASGSSPTTDMEISWAESETTRIKKFSLSGSGEGLGILTVKGTTNSHSFGTVYVGTQAQHTLTLMNKGIASANNISLNFTSLNYAGGTCPSTANFTLAASEECTLVFTFAPMASGTLHEELRVQYDNSSTVIDEKLFEYSGIASNPASLTFNYPAPYSIGTFARNVSHHFTVTIQNSGQGTATLLSNSLSNPLFTYNGGTFPGADPEDGSTDCSTTILSGQSCTIHVKYSPTTNGTHSATLALQYNDGILNQNISHTITGTGADLGYINAFPKEIVVPNAIVTGSPSTQTFIVNNIGTGPATITAIDALVGGFTVDSSSTCQTTPVVPAAGSCTYIFKFLPTSGGAKTSDFKITYTDGLTSTTRNSFLRSTGLIRAELANSLSNKLEYGNVVVNTNKLISLRLSNSKTAFASAITVDGLDSTFSLVSNGCSTPIGQNEGCILGIQFRPTALIDYTKSFRVRYFDGIETKEIFFTATGKGENPPSNHGGWTRILAYGSRVSVSNNDLNDKRVVLSWNSMTPTTSSTITGYNIYRSTVSGTYSTPIATNISASLRTFTDTSVSMNTTYYYYVVPVINGQDSKVNDASAHVKVSVPPANMVLVHRWMANKEVCERLGRSVEKNNNYICNYIGRGNKTGKYDIGYDYFVDRYELGSDRTNRPEQTPSANFNQTQANESCKLSDKTLLSRQEWTIATLWSSNLLHPEIEQRESGIYGNTSCNGSGGALEETGRNPDCESLFGVENGAGNVWEWVSDRVYNGTGVTLDNQRLVITNKDIDGLDIGDLNTNLLEFQPCYSFPIGIPVPQVSGVCPSDSINITSTPSAYFHSDHYFGAADLSPKGGLVGGSFGPPAGSVITSSGVMTHAWINLGSAAGGARCGKRAP